MEQPAWDICSELEAFTGKSFSGQIHYNLSSEVLFQKAIKRKEGVETSTGALLVAELPVNRRGRSPNDKFFVKDPRSKEARQIHWGSVNRPIDRSAFEKN